MIVQLSKRPKAWINTLVLAGMTVFAVSAQAQQRHTAVEADAIMVSMGDGGSSNEVAQVSFLDCLGGGSSCDSGGSCLGGSCLGGCGSSSCCSKPWWSHRTGGFGQFLLLRPGNADVIYEIEHNDAAPSNPTGPMGRLNVDEENGYRVGMNFACSDCTSLVASYTNFQGDTRHAIDATGGNVLVSQVTHPDLFTTGNSSLSSSGSLEIDFQLVDLAYRHIWKADNTCAINWLAGFRYGNLEQEMSVAHDRDAGTGIQTVETELDFHGFGMLLGVDGERYSCKSGLFVYGRGLSSFLAGDWRGDYLHTQQIGGAFTANEYEDYRITPVLELELGFGWQSDNGKWRGTLGYMNSAWYNAISTRAYVDAVRDRTINVTSSSYTDLDETVTFSGLTAGFEGRF